MTDEDENELHRLSEMLREVHDRLDENSPSREAVTKAGLALSLAFIHGHRVQIEEWAANIGRPLSEAQRDQLRKFGVKVD